MEMESAYSGMAAWKEVDWQRLTGSNIQRLKSLMERDGVDALFVHRVDNFQYVTGYMTPTHYNLMFYTLRQGAILLAGEEQPIMLAGAADIFDVKNFWWIKDVRSMPWGLEPWPKIIKEVFHDYGFTGGKVAVDPDTTYILMDSLRQELGEGYRLVSAGPILEEARGVKNPEEIKVIRRAAGLASAMVVTAKGAIREGVREIDVAVEAERTLSRLEPLAYPSFKPTISSGERAAYLDRIPSAKVIGNGEIVMIDAGCRYMGYYSEFSRHVMVGKPTEEQKRLYRTALAAEQNAVKAIEPGARSSDIDRIARQTIEEAGYGAYQHAHYTGHGHGIGIHDAPILGDPRQEKEYIIEPGMVVAVEPAILKPGVGGVRVEDVVLVTESGHEVLSKVDYEEKLLD
jgi:Xaa-Pro aminopeptidase